MVYPQLPDKVYNVLKWLCIIVAPAAVNYIATLAEAWGWNIPVEAITKTITSTALFVGVVLGFSTLLYALNKKNETSDEEIKG